ncbi:MAG TPA: DNA-directed RNA polymerase subunit omega [Pyrinomonadaceae bacterium]|jgi:DNA-directed RNA polymerase subunit K/omega
MKKTNKTITKELELVKIENPAELHRTDSVFMGINMAGLRHRQLNQGAHSRLIGDSPKNKNTIVAVKEVKEGLIAFRFVEEPDV